MGDNVAQAVSQAYRPMDSGELASRGVHLIQFDAHLAHLLYALHPVLYVRC